MLTLGKKKRFTKEIHENIQQGSDEHKKSKLRGDVTPHGHDTQTISIL